MPRTKKLPPGLRLRDGIYHVDFAVGGGPRIRVSAATRDLKVARRVLDKLRAEAHAQAKLGKRARALFATAAAKWVREHTHLKRLRDVARHIQFWRGHYTYLDEITRDNADAHVATMSNVNANRHMATLRSILRDSQRKWNLLDRVPALRMRAEPAARIRWITHDEAVRLIGALPEPHRPLVTFLFATGLRLGSATQLRWDQVDTDAKRAWVDGSQTKTKRAIAIPLNADALAVLESIPRGDGQVFTTLPPTNATWKRACARAGIADFRIHDTRHTWASWHVQAGTPLLALRDLGGWATLAMVQRYAHLSPGHLAGYADNVVRH